MKIKLFYQKNIDISSLSSKIKDSFDEVVAFNDFKAIDVNENLKIILVIDFDFFIKNKITIWEIKATLFYYSIILVYDEESIDKISEKDNFFNNFIALNSIKYLLNRIISSELSNLKQLLINEEKFEEINQFNKDILEIGLKIGSERNTPRLLDKMLFQSMKLSKADAGSIAVLNLDKNLKRTNKNILTFYASKNISKDIQFNRFSLKVSSESLAGYVVLTREILKINDAYHIDPGANYSFNRGFDEKTKFRTKSILVIPLINQKDEIMGVIQLLNKKRDFNLVIDYENNFNVDDIIDFTNDDVTKLTSLSNFLTVSLENAILYNEIDGLFNSFVEASVSAVEQRDPVTSGHSSRVAKYSINLANSCNSSKGILEEYNFDALQIRELRYAALLHDFGKIGVRENVLVKSTKLSELQIKNIYTKINLYIMQMKLNVEKEKIKLISKKEYSLGELKKKILAIDNKVNRKIKELENDKVTIEKANLPNILEKNVSSLLDELKNKKLITDFGENLLLSEEEYKFLSIKKGNLGAHEREEIESHVTHTYNFLYQIPWTKDLNAVAEIAYGHHEKLDGTGYPLKKKAKDILPQTKIMTICDIFDALTASDRPYKKALGRDVALDIIYEEVEDGKLERSLVDVFVKNKCYQI